MTIQLFNIIILAAHLPENDSFCKVYFWNTVKTVDYRKKIKKTMKKQKLIMWQNCFYTVLLGKYFVYGIFCV